MLPLPSLLKMLGISCTDFDLCWFWSENLKHRCSWVLMTPLWFNDTSVQRHISEFELPQDNLCFWQRRYQNSQKLCAKLHHKELNITKFTNKDDTRFYSLKYPQVLTHKICEPKTVGRHLPVPSIWYSNWEVDRGYCQSSVPYAQLACKWSKCVQVGSINPQWEQECR